MTDCIFCKIISGDIPSFKVYEDEQFLGFLDLGQIVDGHTLLVPKNHYRWIWDVPNIDELYKAANKIVSKMRSVTGSQSVTSLTIGEMVEHAHMHLLPTESPGVLDKIIEKWDWGLNQRKISNEQLRKLAKTYESS